MTDKAVDIPLVSVVIPMYQAEAWITDTLASAAAQTHPRVETIVVDDGSLDQGADLVSVFGESAERPVRLVQTTNNVVSRLPAKPRSIVADLIAGVVYWPLARVARLVERTGRDPSFLPLFQYRQRSFYVMRNDAFDRFGTRLEKRYSQKEARNLLERAGLENLMFVEGPPWWVAVGWRRCDGP